MDVSGEYDQSFFEMHVPWRHEYDAISDILARRLTFSSVLDMGCGNGFIIARLAQLGKDVMGIDGSAHALQCVDPELQSKVRLVDLTEPVRLRKYDLVICSEVAEHLDPGHADTLVDNICWNGGGSVFFTAATPGQGGHRHINEQPHEYWIAKFEQRKFRLDHELTWSLRHDLSKVVHAVWWFTNNALIFHCPRDPEAATSATVS